MLFVCNLPGLFWCFSYYKTRVQGGQVSLSSSAYCFPCSGHHVELIRGFPNESSCIQIYNDTLTSQGLERQEQPMRCFELPVPFFDHQAIGSILPAPVRICNWTRCFWVSRDPPCKPLGAIEVTKWQIQRRQLLQSADLLVPLQKRVGRWNFVTVWQFMVANII